MRNFVYQLKMILREKSFIFWIVLFPIILTSIYSVGFQGIGDTDIEAIKVGIEKDNRIYNILRDIDILELIEIDPKNAGDKLENADIIGYINEDLSISVARNGIRQTILGNIVREIKQIIEFYTAGRKIDNSMESDFKLLVGLEKDNSLDYILREIGVLELVYIEESEANNLIARGEIVGFIKSDGSPIIEENAVDGQILKSIMAEVEATMEEIGSIALDVDYTKDGKTSMNKTSPMATVFYATIALASTYGCYPALEYVAIYNGNLSSVGIRLNTVPIKKYKFLIMGILVSLTINLASNMILLGYLKYILKEDIIYNLGASLGLIVIGNLYGIVYGMAIGSIKGLDYGKKNLLMILINLALAALSGMMSPDIKNLVEAKLPFVNKMNPLANITNGMIRHNLLNFDTSLLIEILPTMLVILILTGVAYMNLRGEQYDSL